MQIKRILTRTEIQWGLLSYSKKTKNEFYDKLPDVFEVVCGTEIIESRRAGKKRMWLTVDLMRKFKIGQILILKIKDGRLHMSVDPDQDPDTMKEFSISN